MKWFVSFIYEGICFITGCIYYNNIKREFLPLFQKTLLVIMRQVAWKNKNKKNKQKKKNPATFPFFANCHYKDYKETITTFCHCRPPKYAFCQRETTNYPQNFPLENCKCQQSQICNTQGNINITMWLRKYLL